MFWNEFDFDSSTTTIMDESGEHDDVQIMIDDDTVYIRQYNSIGKHEIPDLIMMTPKMFKDLLESVNYPEGMYKTVYKREDV